MKHYHYILLPLFVALTACGNDDKFTSKLTDAEQSERRTLLKQMRSQAQQCAVENTYAQDPNYQNKVTKENRPVTLSGINTERAWLRSNFALNYLWKDDLQSVDENESKYNQLSDSRLFLRSMKNYLNDLKTAEITATGDPVDKYSTVTDTLSLERFNNDATDVGSGAVFEFLNFIPPRDVRVTQVFADSPAQENNISRGDKITDIIITNNGDVTNLNIDDDDLTALYDALYRPDNNSSYTYKMQKIDGTPYEVSFTPTNVVETTVPIVKTISTNTKGDIGYILFNNHTRVAELALFDAVTALKNDNIDNLILDLRYNSGGFLYISQILASMLHAESAVNQPYIKLTHNNLNADDDRTIHYRKNLCVPTNNSCTRSNDLPNLNLKNLYVLTTNDTCSASEALINGLKPTGINITLIGAKTCGKPVGFSGRDNCGLTYYLTEFSLLNANNEGDYHDGIAPTCEVADDLTHQLGDPAESLLAEALHHFESGTCTPNPTLQRPYFNKQEKLARRIKDDYLAHKRMAISNDNY